MAKYLNKGYFIKYSKGRLNNMKIKIIVILICTLLLSATIPVLGTIKEDNKYEEQSNNLFSINIYQPVDEYIYFGGKKAFEIPYLPFAIILGKITFKVNISSILPIECVNWYVDGILEEQYTSEPYDWYWPMFSNYSGLHTVKAEAVGFFGVSSDDFVIVFKLW